MAIIIITNGEREATEAAPTFLADSEVTEEEEEEDTIIITTNGSRINNLWTAGNYRL